MRKRSKYRPYRVDAGAGMHAIAMQHGMADDQLHEQQIALVPRAACCDAMLECRRRMQRGEVLNTVAA